ncbi:MAG: hypothetical protein RLZ05_1310 [Bacteroidota bacterium]|jgi:hypothetical protein
MLNPFGSMHNNKKPRQGGVYFLNKFELEFNLAS